MTRRKDPNKPKRPYRPPKPKLPTIPQSIPKEHNSTTNPPARVINQDTPLRVLKDLIKGLSIGHKLGIISAIRSGVVSIEEAAQQEGFPPDAIRLLLRDRGLAAVIAPAAAQAKKNVSGLMWSLSQRALESISDADLEEMSAYQRTVIAAINAQRAMEIDAQQSAAPSTQAAVADLDNRINKLMDIGQQARKVLESRKASQSRGKSAKESGQSTPDVRQTGETPDNEAQTSE